MSTSLSIALDAMGGDAGPQPALDAVKIFLDRYPDTHITLVGRLSESSLDDQQDRSNIPNNSPSFEHERLTLVDNDTVIASDLKPSKALRSGRQSSMWVSLELLANQQVDACVSAGNTGALMAISRFVLGVFKGIERPAICKAVPTMNGETYLLDLGANIQCDEYQLFQFAILGAAIAQSNGIERPRIALLNIGRESEKGHIHIQAAAKRLNEQKSFDFIGFVEGDTLYEGQADVVVCDGFSGNIALKTSEGVVRFLIHRFKTFLSGSLLKRWLAFFIKPIFSQWLAQFEPQKYNGASLLGLNGLVIKCHGSSDKQGFLSALEVARLQIKAKQLSRIETLLQINN